MTRLFSSLAAGAALLLGAAAPAAARPAPSTIELETCWYGVCAGVNSRYHLVVIQPILNPDAGEIYNSQGLAGFYTWNPFDDSIQLITINYPVGIYTGSLVSGCLSGTTGQIYYNGYGDFYTAGCP